jgi:Lrp/AsnC family leucine-responsive transcriptional regulator
MDQIDRQLLELLKQNSRRSISEMSREVDLSIPAVRERVKRLEEQGVIAKYTLRVDRGMTDQGLLTYVGINVEHSMDLAAFKAFVLADDRILSCHHISGEFDYFMKVALKDTDCLEDFIMKDLKCFEGVKEIKTMVAFSTIKEE